MTRRTAFALIVALPGLVTADIYRLRPSPDIARPDILPWNMRVQKPEPIAVRSALPSWANTYSVSPAERSSNRVPCPCPAAQHLGLCLSQPDCLTHVNPSVLRLHAPRMDEQKTVVKEKRMAEGRVRDGQPVR